MVSQLLYERGKGPAHFFLDPPTFTMLKYIGLSTHSSCQISVGALLAEIMPKSMKPFPTCSLLPCTRAHCYTALTNTLACH